MDAYQATVSQLNDEIERSIQRAIWGEPVSAPDAPPLTCEHLKALHDYLKPETLMADGTAHEVFGYTVYQGGYVPEGYAVLIAKQKPGTLDSFDDLGKGVVIVKLR